jgi:hypothetical protein
MPHTTRQKRERVIGDEREYMSQRRETHSGLGVAADGPNDSIVLVHLLLLRAIVLVVDLRQTESISTEPGIPGKEGDLEPAGFGLFDAGGNSWTDDLHAHRRGHVRANHLRDLLVEACRADQKRPNIITRMPQKQMMVQRHTAQKDGPGHQARVEAEAPQEARTLERHIRSAHHLPGDEYSDRIEFASTR